MNNFTLGNSFALNWCLIITGRILGQQQRREFDYWESCSTALRNVYRTHLRSWGSWIKLEQNGTLAAWATKNGNSSSHFTAKEGPPLWSKRQILDSAEKRLQLVWLTQRSASYSTVCLVLQAVARNWVLDEIMDKLHGKVREQAQKNRSGQPW